MAFEIDLQSSSCFKCVIGRLAVSAVQRYKKCFSYVIFILCIFFVLGTILYMQTIKSDSSDSMNPPLFLQVPAIQQSVFTISVLGASNTIKLTPVDLLATT